MKKEWLIWSIEHNAWWGHGQRGYVADARVAGRYALDEAREIVHGANIGMRLDWEALPNEAIVHVSVLKASAAAEGGASEGEDDNADNGK